MKRPALQNKQVVVYEWLIGPEKFSGLSTNGSQTLTNFFDISLSPPTQHHSFFRNSPLSFIKAES